MAEERWVRDGEIKSKIKKEVTVQRKAKRETP